MKVDRLIKILEGMKNKHGNVDIEYLDLYAYETGWPNEGSEISDVIYTEEQTILII